MKNKAIYFLLGLSFLFITACDHLASGSLHGSKAPANTILIEFQHVNYAWGYIDNRSFLTVDGKLAVFFTRDREDPRLNQWIEPDAGGWLEEEDLVANYSMADSTFQVIEAQALRDHNVATLAQLVEENLSEPEGRCIDFGVMTLWAYQWDEEAKKYRRQLIEQCGDLAIKNENENAQQLIEALNELALFTRGCCF
ncbi:MAG: hypothetical protein AAF985_24045 [Bacteroidota bacterium]